MGKERTWVREEKRDAGTRQPTRLRPESSKAPIHRINNHCEQPSEGIEAAAGQVPLSQQGFPQQVPLGGQHLVSAQHPEPPEVVAHPDNAETIRTAASERNFFMMRTLLSSQITVGKHDSVCPTSAISLCQFLASWKHFSLLLRQGCGATSLARSHIPFCHGKLELENQRSLII